MTAPHVTVRMYKGVLGDCFLLRLFKAGPPPRRGRKADAHILIDCGVLQRAPGEKARIRRIAEDVKATCGGKLDLVAVTHEHYDHLSGFGTAADLFFGTDTDPGIEIGQLWLAWTEKAGDPQAERLRGLRDETRMAIAAGVERMALRNPNRDQEDWVLDGEAAALDGFIGPFGFGAGERLSSAQILVRLKEKVQPDGDLYLEPGEVRETPGAVKLRAYVLGPPREEEMLFKDLPSGAAGKRETYFAAREAEVRTAARNFGSCDEQCGLEGMPFSRRYRQISEFDLLHDKLTPPPQPMSAAQASLWTVRNAYLGEDWRRIDDDWHGAVGNLALKLDSDTNNTSLVLAFEIEAGGDILLFAADAQVGNWLSWHKRTYPDPSAAGGTVSATDLLARTALYKVGHHGSHNATLSALGLEMMTHGGLVALLPLVEDWAKKRLWPMPFGELYARLLERTEGRILRGDAPVDPAMAVAQPGFMKRVREDDAAGSELGPLWVEYDAS